MLNIRRALLAGLAIASLGTAATARDRLPTADETAAIEQALRGQGFTSWSAIELDDGKWEIDNAVGPDGKRYDVDLALNDLSVIRRELD